MRILAIGGSDAGVSAALRAREVRADAEATMLVADEYPNFSIFGLPFLFSGEVPDYRKLFHRTLEELLATGLDVRLSTRALHIDAKAQRVAAESASGMHTFEYDRLVVGTGARPARPPIEGLDLPGVHVLHDMAHAHKLLDAFATTDARSAVIIGGGYIGLEGLLPEGDEASGEVDHEPHEPTHPRCVGARARQERLKAANKLPAYAAPSVPRSPSALTTGREGTPCPRLREVRP
jgi:NAD(P)H-nitrite reductase large subunit